MRMPDQQPFESAEAAWFWAMRAIHCRRLSVPPPPACCTPETVLRCVDDAYRRRGIELLHARVLRHYGQRGRAPRRGDAGERCDRILWDEAMAALDAALRHRGVVAGVTAWV